MRVRGVISNRVLLNYRCDPEVAAALLPDGLRPRLVHGHSIVGVCLIELRFLRPRGMPRSLGLDTMNAGYRIAVEWGESPVQHGVYLPRRDTDSRVTTWLGGRLFPGVHHRARFETSWRDDRITIRIATPDHQADLCLDGRPTDRLEPASVFGGIDEVSSFFRHSDRGFSAGRGRTEGMRLVVEDWRVRPLRVRSLHAGFFHDASRFPADSLGYDSAIFMRDVPHEWVPVESPVA